MCSAMIFFHIHPAAHSIVYIQTFTSPYFFSLNLQSARESFFAPGVLNFHICLSYILHTVRTQLSALCHCRQHFLLPLFFCSCCHLCFTFNFRMHICFFPLFTFGLWVFFSIFCLFGFETVKEFYLHKI